MVHGVHRIGAALLAAALVLLPVAPPARTPASAATTCSVRVATAEAWLWVRNDAREPVSVLLVDPPCARRPVATVAAGTARFVHGRLGFHYVVTGRSTVQDAVLDAVVTRVDVGPRPAPGAAADREVLVLYDTTGPDPGTGQTTAAVAATLASHDATVTSRPVADYHAGDLARYDLAVYVGTTYDEPLPPAFLRDAAATTTPLVWANYNIWQLAAATNGFARRFGWSPGPVLDTPVTTVRYRGVELPRALPDAAGVVGITVTDPSRAEVVATAAGADGQTSPWAVRSAALTYVAENPLAYVREADRHLAFADLLAPPDVPERARALVRLEDVGPGYDPALLRLFADYLAERHVPFSVAVIPEERDPLAGAAPVRLVDRPELVAALRYVQDRGGTLVAHGYTHQLGHVPNPIDGSSGADYEFMRMTVDAAGAPRIVGPVTGDSPAWVLARLDAGLAQFEAAGLGRPTIFEFPHYLASPVDYAASTARYGVRYERITYPAGVLGGVPDYTQTNVALLPFSGTDLWGARIIPENLGYVEPGRRDPEDVLADAARLRAVRDPVASVFYHPYLGLDGLRTIVEGLQASGWTFVAPADA